MKFALACEGITDQITLETMLCGFYDNPDLDQDITYLQPPFDVTTQKQMDNAGGYNELLCYLRSSRFREDVINNDFLILQLDTDISDKIGVSPFDEENKELPIPTLIQNVTAKLITEINQGEANFFQKYQTKIIFCLAVHSLECWLLAYYCPPPKPKIKNCKNALDHCFFNKKPKATEAVLKKLKNNFCIEKKTEIKKTRDAYQLLSEPFLHQKTLLDTAKREPSLSIFLNNLP